MCLIPPHRPKGRIITWFSSTSNGCWFEHLKQSFTILVCIKWLLIQTCKQRRIRFKLQKGQLKVRGSDPSATICFGSPHYSARDLSTGTIQQLSTGSRNRGLFYPWSFLSHSGIEIWLLDGKQKTLMLTTTPKPTSVALRPFPRVSRTGFQQAEYSGDNSSSYLTPLPCPVTVT